MRTRKLKIWATSRSVLSHNHALLSWDDSEPVEAEHARLQEEVRATVASLKAKAQTQLEALRKSADIGPCSTAPKPLLVLSPASEQECVVQDLGDALGLLAA